jgi:LPS-assembly protein
MKNSFIKIILILLLNCICISKSMSEDFNFNVTEMIVTDNGNVYNGIKGGSVTTDNGIEITAENFKYNKLTSLLESKGNVVLLDKIKDITIRAEKIFYLKNEELAYTQGKSNALSGQKIEINSSEFFKYDKLNSTLSARGDVVIIDKIKNITIKSDEAFYFKIEDRFLTKGPTNANIENEYFVDTQNLVLLRQDMLLSSKYKTTIIDTQNNFYKLNNFNYLINEKILKGNKVEVVTNYMKKNNDKYFFNTGFFDFKNLSFLAKDVEINFDKETFDEEKNDPRLKGVAAFGNEFATYLDRGNFTTCKKTDKCPPWIIQSKKIKHDKIKKQIIYKDAWLKLYDIPVAYFPKFFHPDPTVVRQSGFLRPSINNSDLLGTGYNIPYFQVISDNIDITLKPRIYDNDKYVFQTEFRKKTKNSITTADFSYLKGYKSQIIGDTRDSRTHFFSNTIKDLNFKDFFTSNLEIQYQKVSNDTYLKAFNLPSPLLINDNNVLESFVKMDLGNEDYDFTTSFEQYETLSGSNSDRFQYVFPTYSFSTLLNHKKLSGDFNFLSYGKNTLKQTNIMSSNITNDLNYISRSSYLDNGVQSKYGIYSKNLNSIGKNHQKYKSSPQSEILSGYMFDISLPLIKKNKEILSTLEPKLNLRFSPHEMKSHRNTKSKVNASNIYSFNRLGLTDSIEEGASLTIGFDYKKEEKKETDNGEMIDFFNVKLATVIRAKEENNIPITSTINKKNSNILGLIDYSLSDNILLSYDFSIDNDLKTFEYNAIDAEFTYNNFTTTIKFLEETGEIGKAHTIENTLKYNFDDMNSFQFNTRRNKEINLTEYYDLIYQYKNDCLTAAIEFKKQYYTNSDIKPLEELYFSVTIVPLGTFSPEPIVPKSIFNDSFRKAL